jgi:hypothetical protein
MNILITGAGGQLGSRIANFLHSNGHSIRTLGRHPVNPNFKNYSWTLGMSPNPEALKNVDFILHLAWDRTEEDNKSFHLNVGGSSKIFEAANLSRINVFNFSSFSAILPLSNYGQAKKMVEQINSEGTNLRVAKVEMGSESIPSRGSNRLLKKFIYIPAPQNVNVHVIEIESLLQEVLKLLQLGSPAETLTLPFQTLTMRNYLAKYQNIKSFSLPKILFHSLFKCLRIGSTKKGLLLHDRWVSLISTSQVVVK